MTRPVIIVGAGGHGKVVADALLESGWTVLGFLDPDPSKRDARVLGMPVLGDDHALRDFSPEAVLLANGIGSVGSIDMRRDIHQRFIVAGYTFMSVLHPSAIVAKSARLAAGVQVMAGAVVQAEASIGENTLINTGARIDHDCVIGRHCHVAPGCVLSGSVTLGDECHVGTGASVRQGVQLGSRTIVGVGAGVVKNYPGGFTLLGVPATIRQ